MTVPKEAQALVENVRRLSGKIGGFTSAHAPYFDTLYLLFALGLISAVWFESDTYRYAGLIFALVGLTHYYLKPDRPSIGLMAHICVAWAICVGLRIAYTFVFHREMGIGSSEGIYLLPILYSTLGYTFLVFIRRPFVLILAFACISFLVVAASFDASALQSGQRAWFGLHHNPIHAAVGTGMIVLCMLPFAHEVMRRKNLRPALRRGLAAMAIVTFLLGIVNVYGLQSKGVWLSLAVALPLQAILLIALSHSRAGLYVMLGCIVAAGILVALLGDGMQSVADDTFNATLRLAADIGNGGGFMESMARAIDDPSAPQGFRERLMLWASALEIVGRAPLFGNGVAWLHFWQDRAYPQTDFNLLHNGYLEIAIRYGIAGLVFYFALFVWAVRCVWRAYRRGLVPAAAVQCYISLLVFFAMTITNNSNVRLAIGESFMWCAASFAFYCHFLMQEVDTGKNRYMFLPKPEAPDQHEAKQRLPA
ncbi:O-antigen ligase family protein [Aquamicrobium sp. LC103]|uniref:O-antigen ligase family protein n=1 Tax=Aquamicrobium sp. LC103 TaxID=1120658 RepID=UPI00069B782A|nr:O-antigen ligase family protein [Aquamicrobium sp. LC103]TKT83006.1 O-antigen ligase family protein [Aquamicrobium sp. LC103]